VRRYAIVFLAFSLAIGLGMFGKWADVNNSKSNVIGKPAASASVSHGESAL